MLVYARYSLIEFLINGMQLQSVVLGCLQFAKKGTARKSRHPHVSAFSVGVICPGAPHVLNIINPSIARPPSFSCSFFIAMIRAFKSIAPHSGTQFQQLISSIWPLQISLDLFNILFLTSQMPQTLPY